MSEIYSFEKINSKPELEAYFRRDNVLLHLYEIGDLDDFFWSQTSWTALKDETGKAHFIVLTYAGADPPVVIALGGSTDHGVALLNRMLTTGLLSTRFYSHLSLGLSESLVGAYCPEHHGQYCKMGLSDRNAADSVDTSAVQLLLPAHLPEIEAFYRVHYPGNWFDSKMLDTRQTFGIWSASTAHSAGELVAIAGVHVYSVTYSVAALGNIAVHLDHRGKGLARLVTAALVKSLLSEGIQHIGLNVLADNGAAVACYKRLGFIQIAQFEEIMWDLR